MISNSADIKELVRSRTDLVQIVGESLTLVPQRGGRSFKALCPFHDDHNPSMEVNPERQTFRCWVCNEGGDCFSWVMKYEGLGFREALESLAKRAGVELPQFRQEAQVNGPSTSEKSSLWEVLAWAEQEFHRYLLQAASAEGAREYLRSRNFSQETIAQYRLGYHPDHWEWMIDRARGRFSPEQLEAARLIKARESNSGEGVKSAIGSRYFDYFVDRVLFPIHDERGRCVAFGGRVLPNSRYTEGGKYFNSPESPVFQKNRLIFGLDKARDAIRKTGTAVVMEGYVDVIKAHQAGVKNAVATLGTALTENHVSVLRRLAEKVVLVYDGDEAGVRAAVRAIDKFLAQDVDLRVLTLPNGDDPDEFLDAHGTAAFDSLISSAPPAWDVRYQHCVAHFGTASVPARLKVLEEMVHVLASCPTSAGSTQESLLLAQLAQRLSIPEADARRRLFDVRQKAAQPRKVLGNFSNGNTSGMTGSVGVIGKVSAGDSLAVDESAARKASIDSLQRNASRDDLLECEVLQVLLTSPATIAVVRREIGVDDILHPALRELLALCCDLDDQGELPDLGRVLAATECPELKRLVVWIDGRAQQCGLSEKLWNSVSSVRSSSEKTRDDAEGTPSGSTDSANFTPALLSELLASLKFRRQRTAHQSHAAELSRRLDATGGLNPELKVLLERASSFHQKRATLKPMGEGTGSS